MPWRSVALISLRKEFVTMAEHSGVAFSDLCRRFGVSRKTGYKWVRRFQEEGGEALADRSRRPHRVQRRVPPAVEESIVALRVKHPVWGARKIRRRLLDAGVSPPAKSTITAVLHRHGLITPDGLGGRGDWQRFEHPAPNSLWQMDFKRPVVTLAGRVHPLTILDDHSRFNLCLQVLPHQQTISVETKLTDTFQRYGLPDRVLVDNGSPWGSDADHVYTPLGVWLLRLGVFVSHSRAYHPQTLGKEERFHRTLQQEVLTGRQWQDVTQLQGVLDRWRHVYNFERPHDALNLDVPAARYQPSLRSFPERLPPIEYPTGLLVRKVQQGGIIHYRGREYRIGKSFTGYPVGLQPTRVDGVINILFAHHQVNQINLQEDS